MSIDTQWFEDSRFGMFIHWGLYSNPGGCWSGRKIRHPYSEWLQASEPVPRNEYRNLAAAFNPREFNAEEWVLHAQSAGMKYLVITAKHHDGFALWPSRVSNYNIYDATPFRRDVLQELSEACVRHGLKFGFYYSHWLDWEGVGGDVDDVYMHNAEYRHPSPAEFDDYWQNKCMPQVRELLERYCPALFWFDSWDERANIYITLNRQDELINLIKQTCPDCLVNSRICYTAPSERVDFLSMMDNCFPDATFDKPWETSGTLNASWGYHQLDYCWQPAVTLLKNLINNASLGGNYQLNVGPMGNGKFQPAAVKRLRDIGNWLAVNGESIYGTSRGMLPRPEWGRITTRQSASGLCHYLHLYHYMPGAAIPVDGLESVPQEIKVLETGQPVHSFVADGRIWLKLPAELQGLELPVLALQL